MKILYLKGYKWSLSQIQRVRIDCVGYILYEALTKDQTFFKKTLKSKDVSTRTVNFEIQLFCNFISFKSVDVAFY